MRPEIKYQKCLDASMFSEKDLIYFRKLINGNGSLVTSRWDLLNSFQRKAKSQGIDLEESQKQKGLDWLTKKCFKLNGSSRRNSPLNAWQRVIVRQYSDFKCVGLHNLSTGEYRQYVPIYRCFGVDGESFDYICKMWGEIEVIKTSVDRPKFKAVNGGNDFIPRRSQAELRLVGGAQ